MAAHWLSITLRTSSSMEGPRSRFRDRRRSSAGRGLGTDHWALGDNLEFSPAGPSTSPPTLSLQGSSTSTSSSRGREWLFLCVGRVELRAWAAASSGVRSRGGFGGGGPVRYRFWSLWEPRTTRLPVRWKTETSPKDSFRPMWDRWRKSPRGWLIMLLESSARGFCLRGHRMVADLKCIEVLSGIWCGRKERDINIGGV